MSSPMPSPASDAPALAVLAVAAIAAPLLLAGCGGGGGGGSQAQPLPPANTITSIAVVVATAAVATVAVDSVAADGAGKVTFTLDGGTTGSRRPADPGHRKAQHVYDFTATASDAGAPDSKDFYVVINPLPQTVIDPSTLAVQRLRHFFNRAGFGCNEEDYLRWLNVPYNTMVDALVDASMDAEDYQAPPGWINETIPNWEEIRVLSTAQMLALNEQRSARLSEMYRWWLREMIKGNQLRERMALFWHNHFVTNAGDIFEPRTTWEYLAFLRENALGNFGALVRGIARNPAMCVFLDTNNNVKGRPNENFARELLELFTLGEGKGYSEADVVEVAKCFTGWGTSDRQAFEFHTNQHEPGTKTVFGTAITNAVNSTEADGEQVLTLALARIHAPSHATIPRAAILICEKLWDEFIGGARDTTVINGWAQVFHNNSYAIAPVLKTIFTSATFTAASLRGSLVRSPIELWVAIWRGLDLEPADVKAYNGLHWMAGEEDQSLLNPPNVRGWIGGLTWINPKTLLARRQHLVWTGGDLRNKGNHLVPVRLDGALPTLLFAVPTYDQAAITAGIASESWDTRAVVRYTLRDLAIHAK